MKRFKQSMRFGAMSHQFINMIDGDPDGGGGGEPIVVAPVDSAISDPAPVPAADPVTPVDYFSTAPEDWRAQMLGKAGFEAGDDYDKAMKQLDRVSDFGVLAKNYLSAQDKIRSGEMSTGLPENPSDEQLADWREARGVPNTPEEYTLSLEDGLELGEGDEVAMNEVYKIAHANDVTPEVVSQITSVMLQHELQKQDTMIVQDGVDQQTITTQLKEVWGGDYTGNLNMVKGLLNQLPETIKDPFMNARMPGGKALLNSPEVMVALSEWARTINPSATVVPNSANPMQTMNDEIKALEGKMGTSEWSKDIDSQQRYMKLIDAREQMAG